MDSIYAKSLREAKTELFNINEKLSHKEGAIQSKLQHKSSQLKKGKEKALEVFQQQMKGSERKMVSEIDEINKKIEALEQRRDRISKNYDELIVNHYNPLIKGLYEEGAVSIDDLSLPMAYHELLSKKNTLVNRIKMYEGFLKQEEEAQREKYTKIYEAKKRREQEEYDALKRATQPEVPVVAQEPKGGESVSDTTAEAPSPPPVPVVKKSPKVIKVRQPIPAPSEQDIQRIKQETRENLEKNWNIRHKRMIRGEERIPDATDSFFTSEPLAFLEPIEIQCYGNQYDRLMRMRHSYIEDQEELAKARESELKVEEEVYRARLIEKAKYGSS